MKFTLVHFSYYLYWLYFEHLGKEFIIINRIKTGVYIPRLRLSLQALRKKEAHVKLLGQTIDKLLDSGNLVFFPI